MRNLLLCLVLLAGCATVKADVKHVGTDIKADIAACKPEEQEAMHVALPLIADYAICVAMNKGDATQCAAQGKTLVSSTKASAISCGLAVIQAADAQATAAAK